VAIGLIVLIGFTGVAHGAVEPLSRAIYQISIITLLLIWVAKIILSKDFTVIVPRIALPIAGLLVYGIVQSVATTNSSGERSGLSMDIEATRQTLMLLGIQLAALLIACNFLYSHKRLRAVAKFLTFYGLILGLFAIVQHFTWNGRYFWLRPTEVTTGTGMVGTFVNHNHFAGYMELLVPIPVALLFTKAVTKTKALYTFAAVVMAVGVISSLSRGGMISLFFELASAAVLGAVLYKDRRSRDNQQDKLTGKGNFSNFVSRYGTVAAIAVAIVIGTIWVGATPVLSRLSDNQVIGSGQSFDVARGWVWRDTWTMIKANPIFGVGLGAFGTAYPIYSRDNGMHEFGGNFIVDRAHNDYLQVLADCGVIGFALLLWFIIEMVRLAIAALKVRDSLLRGLAIGATAACVAMLIHSAFDFNLQLPSHGLLLLIFAGILHSIGSMAKRDKTITETYAARAATHS
jgi:O-antigen ligase